MTTLHASTELLLTAAGLAAVAAKSLRLVVEGEVEGLRAAVLGSGREVVSGRGYWDTGG